MHVKVMKAGVGPLSALWLVLCASVAQADAAPPLEAFGALPVFGQASLSPDGKHLAVIRPINGETTVYIHEVANLKAVPHAVAVPGAVAEGVLWPNNDRLICIFRKNQKEVYSRDVYEWSRAVSVDVDGGSPVVLLGNQPTLKLNTNGAAIVDTPPEDPNHVYMLAIESWRPSLFRVDVATGAGELVMRSPEGTTTLLMDGHGNPFGRIEQDAGLKNHIFIGNHEAGMFDSKGGSGLEFEGVAESAGTPIAVKSTSVNGVTGLYTWGLPQGVGTILFADPKFDIDDVITDERTRRIIGVTYADDRMRSHYFDPAIQHLQEELEAALPGQSVSIVSKDAAGAIYLVEADGPRNPPSLLLFTPATNELKTIVFAYPDLRPADLGVMKPYAYKARDGLDIPAYLTLPPGREPHNLPTIVLPHGGPEARDMLRFDWLTQFLASRGYAVLQPNFRGSAGYGRSFTTAGDGEWARKVQFDVQDGVKKLIDDKIADPKRICIVGWSYGGYMALAGATFSPDLYACAASFAGLSDLNRAFYSGSKFESEALSVWERRVGGSRSDTGNLNAQSPAKHADQVKAPVLLMHSDKDVTVPIEQSKFEADALKSAGKPVQFITMDGDDHQLSYAKTRIQMLTELEKFLAANIGH